MNEHEASGQRRSEVEARAFQSPFRLTMTFEQPPSRSAVFFGSLYEYDVTNVYATMVSAMQYAMHL